uniref:Pr1-like protein n=1 Tax=Oryza sativa subsp. japonica TaxID=39947 RepID=Q5VMT6_ORYSJ|nr:pr1-like protein [Oryza sativa Japonica Group]
MVITKPRERARGPGPREWGPRVSLSVHGGPGARGWRRSAPWVPRVSRTRGRGRLTAGPTWQPRGRARRRPRRHGRREAARPRPDGHRRRPPARRSGARESGEEREAKGRSSAHPGSTATTGTAAEAEEGGGAVRDGEDDGAPAVGERSGGVAEVDGDAAKPKEVTPRGEEVRSDDGGEPELGGDGGEKVRRCGLDSDGEERRRVAETEEESTGNAYIAPGERENGRRGRKRARRSRPPLKTPAKIAGAIPNGSEGERERKEGEKREGITGSDSPHFNARGDGGRRRNRRRRRR